MYLKNRIAYLYFSRRSFFSIDFILKHSHKSPSQLSPHIHSQESESTWSSRRPIEVVCQDFKPLRPYFTVIEWSGLGGFSCAAAEYFGLPWWWAHELQVRGEGYM